MMSPAALCLAALVFAQSTFANLEADIQKNPYDEPIPKYRHQVYLILAHGALMGFAFAVMFPLGAIMIRLIPTRHTWKVHAIWQVLAYTIALAGLGIGAWLAKDEGRLWTTGAAGPPHNQIGLAVVAALLVMPFTGWAHHLVFKSRGARNFMTHIHVWWGRPVLILGGINGGIGIWYTHGGFPSWALTAYCVLAAVFYAAWFVTIAVFEVRKVKGKAPSMEKADSEEGIVYDEEKPTGKNF